MRGSALVGVTLLLSLVACSRSAIQEPFVRVFFGDDVVAFEDISSLPDLRAKLLMVDGHLRFEASKKRGDRWFVAQGVGSFEYQQRTFAFDGKNLTCDEHTLDFFTGAIVIRRSTQIDSVSRSEVLPSWRRRGSASTP